MARRYSPGVPLDMLPVGEAVVPHHVREQVGNDPHPYTRSDSIAAKRLGMRDPEAAMTTEATLMALDALLKSKRRRQTGTQQHDRAEQSVERAVLNHRRNDAARLARRPTGGDRRFGR